MTEPTMIRCEGSGSIGHVVYPACTRRMCEMCGHLIELTGDSTVEQHGITVVGVMVDHQRRDILADLKRGDFG